MRTIPIATLICFTQCFAAPIAAKQASAPVAAQKLFGISREEADSLIAKLELAQSRLTRGEQQFFTLLFGAPASYEQSKLSPRQVFLDLPFKRVSTIRRIGRDRVLERLNLEYEPRGPGQLYWDIEVQLFSGNIERVAVIYKIPPPP